MSADSVYAWANWVLVGALVLGVAATYAIVVSGKIRDAALQRELGAAKESAAKAIENAAHANEAAERERTERLRLQAAIAPRAFDIETQHRLVQAFLGFAGKIVSVKSYTTDVEGAVLAKQILGCLNAAKVHIVDHSMTESPGGALAQGVLVYGADPALVGSLLASLSAIGRLLVFNQEPPPTMFTLRHTDAQKEPGATIMVGFKPIALLGPAPPGPN